VSQKLCSIQKNSELVELKWFQRVLPSQQCIEHRDTMDIYKSCLQAYCCFLREKDNPGEFGSQMYDKFKNRAERFEWSSINHDKYSNSDNLAWLEEQEMFVWRLWIKATWLDGLTLQLGEVQLLHTLLDISI